MKEIKTYCADVTVGDGNVANCLSDNIAEAELEDKGVWRCAIALCVQFAWCACVARRSPSRLAMHTCYL